MENKQTIYCKRFILETVRLQYYVCGNIKGNVSENVYTIQSNTNKQKKGWLLTVLLLKEY